MRLLVSTCTLALALAATAAFGAGDHQVNLTIKNDNFSPATLHVPAGVRVEVKIHNTRALPSEFESFDLNREKVVPGGTTLSVWIGPLAPGKYKFFDDFNPGVIGHIVADKTPKTKP